MLIPKRIDYSTDAEWRQANREALKKWQQWRENEPDYRLFCIECGNEIPEDFGAGDGPMYEEDQNGPFCAGCFNFGGTD